MAITGSIQKKGNRLYAVLGLPDETGAKKNKWIPLHLTTSASKKEQQEAFERIKQNYDRSSVVYSQNILFADWVSEWLTHKTNQLSQTTIEGYRCYADRRIIPYFKKNRTVLQKMTGIDVQRFYDHLASDGLSPASVRRYNAVVSGSLDYAYKLGIIPENPAKRAELPAASHRNIGSAYTAEEAQQLLNALVGSKIFPAIFLTLYYGLRREEVLGLTWSAINFDAGTIRICKTVTRVTNLSIADTTKNKSSNRTLTITPAVRKVLQDLQCTQAKEKAALGNRYIDSDFICRHEDGRMFTPDYLSNSFQKALKAHNLRPIRLHDLRHTAATLLLSNGSEMQDVKQYLGHSTISITIDLYAHLDISASRKAANAMSGILQV